MLARCGAINAWHWAHRSRGDCDTWSEGETDWHLNWKRRFPRQWREVVIGCHRADIRSPQGIIELQASASATEEIVEREHFYGEMVWVIDASEFRLSVRNRGTHVTFRWKHPHRRWFIAAKPLYFDLGGELLHVRKLHEGPKCSGWGMLLSYEEFVRGYSRPKAGERFCEDCLKSLPKCSLIETGMYEYYTLDLDLQTLLCIDCYECRCGRATPDDPALFDCYTPFAVLV